MLLKIFFFWLFVHWYLTFSNHFCFSQSMIFTSLECTNQFKVHVLFIAQSINVDECPCSTCSSLILSIFYCMNFLTNCCQLNSTPLQLPSNIWFKFSVQSSFHYGFKLTMLHYSVYQCSISFSVWACCAIKKVQTNFLTILHRPESVFSFTPINLSHLHKSVFLFVDIMMPELPCTSFFIFIILNSLPPSSMISHDVP